MSTFGRIFSFAVVEQYVLDLAQKWFTEYLADVERQLGKPPRFFAPLRDWGWAAEFDQWPDEHLPFLLVMDTGLGDQPRRNGDGTWDARRLIAASIIVGSTSRKDTRYAVHAYGAAFKTMMLQHRSLEHPDDIEGVAWIDERPSNLPSEADRSVGAMNMYFYVDVKNVLSERGTPPQPEPRPDPYDPPSTPPAISTGRAQIELVKEIQP